MNDRANNIRNIKKEAAKEPKVKRSNLNRASDKRKGEELIYNKRRPIFLKKHPVCKAKIECNGAEATQVHHSKGRIGKNYLDEKTWMAVCGKCHRFIELNPKIARVKKLSQSRLNKT